MTHTNGGLRQSPLSNWAFFDAPPRTSRASPFYVICNSVPKAGTYLLIELVKALGGHVDTGYHCYTSSISKVHRDGRFDGERNIPAPLWSSSLTPGYLCAAHVEYDALYEKQLLSSKQHKMLFIVRDPRDLVISWVDFVYNSLSYTKMRKWNEVLRERGKLSNPDDASQITSTIRSLPYSGISKYLSWIDSPACLTVRFEDLYGELCDETKTDFPVLNSICDYLEISRRSPSDLVGVLGSGLTESGRKKKVGIYKDRMSPEHLTMLLEEDFQRLVVEFGYEPAPRFEEIGLFQNGHNRSEAKDCEARIAQVVSERERIIADLVAERERQIAALVEERDAARAGIFRPANFMRSLGNLIFRTKQSQ
jgi:hypothetical protein